VFKHSEVAKAIMGENWPDREFHELKKGCQQGAFGKRFV
jgi:hypothetical protein